MSPSHIAAHGTAAQPVTTHPATPPEPTAAMQKVKRTKKLVNSPLQLKMIAVFMGVSATAALFQVVLLNSALSGLARKTPEAGDQLLAELPRIMIGNVALTLVVLVPLMFAVGLVITHRIAGPAYRMTQHCKALARGEALGPCRIRKDDELWELCDALNEAIDTLRATQSGAPAAASAAAEVKAEVKAEAEAPRAAA